MKQSCLENKYQVDFSCGNACKAQKQNCDKDIFVKRWRADEERGINEIKALMQLSNMNCEGVPAFIESKEENGYLYLIREWISGVPLDEFMLANKTMKYEDALLIVQSVCSVFSNIEKCIGPFLHGDIKPQNIIFDEHSQKVSVIDFETFIKASEYELNSMNKLKTTGGHTVSLASEGFTAPEVYSGKIYLESDIYSIGKLIAFIFGVCDIKGDLCELHTLNEKLPKNIVSIIQKCLYKSKDKRYVNKTSLFHDVLNIKANPAIHKDCKTVAGETETDIEQISEKNDSESPVVDTVATTKAELSEGNSTLQAPPWKNDESLNGCSSVPEDSLVVAQQTAGGSKMIPFSKTKQIKLSKQKQREPLMDLSRRKIVYISGNACFASEFAYVVSKAMGLKTVLLDVDNGIGGGMLNYFLDRRNTCDLSYVSDSVEPFFCDIRELYLADEERWISRGLLSTSKKSDNLFISECNIFSEFGVMNENDVLPIFYWAKNFFDVVIISDSVGIDGYSENGMIKYVDSIVVPIRPNIDEVYIKSNQYKWLCRKNGIPYTKLMFVAWEYEKDKSMTENDFRLAVEDRYCGLVKYDAERLKSKNVKGSFYCEKFEKTVSASYRDIITRILCR